MSMQSGGLMHKFKSLMSTDSGSMTDSSTQVRAHRGDHWILVDMILLLVIGVMLIYAISPALADTTKVSGSYYVSHQLLAVFLAGIAFFITAKVPLSTWRSYYKWLIMGAVLMTLVAIALPVNPSYPAHRWVRLGGLSFESVEMLIFAILIWFANFLHLRIKNGSIGNFKKTVKPLIIAILLIAGVVAVIQSDLGSTGVIVAMMGVMAFVAGLPIKKIVILGAMMAGLTVIAIIIFPYRLARLDTFLHPSANCLTTGYQSCQALIAVGSGGITGAGLGSGAQAYGYLPEADNDSIFAIFAEKFGFIGTTLLLALFAALFYKIAQVAEGAPDDFSRLVVVGVLVWISVEMLINVGAMIGLLPLKGITLPFISYGGTSVVFFAAAMGLVYQVSRYTSYKGSRDIDKLNGKGFDDYSSHRRRVGGAYHPGIGNRE